MKAKSKLNWRNFIMWFSLIVAIILLVYSIFFGG